MGSSHLQDLPQIAQGPELGTKSDCSQEAKEQVTCGVAASKARWQKASHMGPAALTQPGSPARSDPTRQGLG